MERWRVQNNTFLGAATGGADTGAPAVFPTKSPIDGSTKIYDLKITVATDTTYTISAEPISTGPNKNDGYLTLQENNKREWTKGGTTVNTWQDN